jgi:hypothetical protein
MKKKRRESKKILFNKQNDENIVNCILQSFQILIGMFEYMSNLFYFKCNYKISNFTFSMNKVIIKNYAQNIFV